MTAPDTDAAATALGVYLDRRRVGTLTGPGHRGTPSAFTYDTSVLGDQTAAVSVRLPVRAAPYSEHEALPCFENLLPDGDLRALLAASVHRATNDVVGLLGVFGGSAPARSPCGPTARPLPTSERTVRAQSTTSVPHSPHPPWLAPPISGSPPVRTTLVGQ